MLAADVEACSPSHQGAKGAVSHSTTKGLSQLSSPSSSLAKAAPAEPQPWSERYLAQLRVMCAVLARHPATGLAPLALFLALVALGVYGVLAGAHNQQRDSRDQALASAMDVGASFTMQVEAAFAPLVALAAHIKHQPGLADLQAVFPDMAQDLMTQLPPGTFLELNLSPFGVIQATYPRFDARIGVDIFANPDLRPGALAALAQRRLVMTGPQALPVVAPQGGGAPPPPQIAGIARLPVFVNASDASETWGNNGTGPSHCTSSLADDNCASLLWDPATGTKFWGFAAAYISFDKLLHGNTSRLLSLQQQGYRYRLTRPPIPSEEAQGLGQVVIAQSEQAPVDPEAVTLSLSAASTWTLSLAPEGGWAPAWWAPVTVAVVLGAATFSLMLCAALVARRRQALMLEEVQVMNARLEQAGRRLALEQERSEALLYRMLPADVAKRLREGTQVDATSYEEVTILFSDIVGFTDMAAQSSAIEICGMLNALYLAFDELLPSFPCIYKVETIGDAYMLVANLTQEAPDHVDQVIRFALHMQQAARLVKSSLGQPISIRVGVHSGPVVASVIGSAMPRFCLFGDTVNTASRMESHGLPSKVHVSAAAYARLVAKRDFDIVERGVIDVKGKGKMTTYLISGAHSLQPGTSPHDTILSSSSRGPAHSPHTPRTPICAFEAALAQVTAAELMAAAHVAGAAMPGRGRSPARLLLGSRVRRASFCVSHTQHAAGDSGGSSVAVGGAEERPSASTSFASFTASTPGLAPPAAALRGGSTGGYEATGQHSGRAVAVLAARRSADSPRGFMRTSCTATSHGAQHYTQRSPWASMAGNSSSTAVSSSVESASLMSAAALHGLSSTYLHGSCGGSSSTNPIAMCPEEPAAEGVHPPPVLQLQLCEVPGPAAPLTI